MFKKYKKLEEKIQKLEILIQSICKHKYSVYKGYSNNGYVFKCSNCNRIMYLNEEDLSEIQKQMINNYYGREQFKRRMKNEN